MYCTIDATKLAADRHEASRGLFATAELLVKVIVLYLLMRLCLFIINVFNFSQYVDGIIFSL